MFSFFMAVFPSEFQQNDGGITCKNISDNTINTFDFPNEFLLDETDALETCQKYCSRNSRCWGCSLICHDGSNICHSGKWNAILQCKILERRVRANGRTLTSLKPRNNIKYIQYIFSVFSSKEF